jgi:large subunit ribosomal protein L28
VAQKGHEEIDMAKRCQLTGSGPKRANRVSHSNIKTPRRQLPNVKQRRYWVPSLGKHVNLQLSTRAMRTIDRLGIDAVVQIMKSQGASI